MAFRELEKIVVSDRWIDEYRREHISRAFEVRLKGGLIKPRHPHRNNPYCNICDRDYEELDLGYRLYVGGTRCSTTWTASRRTWAPRR